MTDPKGMLQAVNQGIAEANSRFVTAKDFGKREDGTQKGEGWLGLLKRPDGDISTELSAGYRINGKEMDVPLVVPTLTAEEVRHLLSLDPQDPQFFNKLMPSVQQKAIAHAQAQLAKGQNVFGSND
jgi:hypothetical protein